MADRAFHRIGVVLSNEEVVFICRGLRADQLKLLCLRECKIRDRDIERILKCVSSCHSLHQLTLNIGIITTMRHVELLAECIQKNKSLTGLHVHGSDLGDLGMQILGHALSNHPGIVSLDVGDCKLSDMSVDVLYSLMLPISNRPGITELTLSDNPRISAMGWAQFAMCLANCNSLRWLFLDYNPLGDYGAGCVLIALSANQSVEVLDLEGCGLTEHTGQIILHLAQNHLGSLSRLKLSNNRIRRSTVEAIKKHISENHLDDLESVSTVTIDDLFSCSQTRQLPSTARDHGSSVSSSSSSSSSSDESSDNRKLKSKHKAQKEKQKYYKDRRKKNNGKEEAEEDTDKEIKKYQEKDGKDDKNKENVEGNYQEKNKNKSKDKQRKDKEKDTVTGRKKDRKKHKESVEDNREKNNSKTRQGMDQLENNNGNILETKFTETFSQKNKMKDKNKHIDDDGKKCKDSTKDTFKKRQTKSSNDKSEQKKVSEKTENKEDKRRQYVSDGGETDDDSIGDELEEVPVFYL